MNKSNNKSKFVWLKRVIAIIAIATWGYIIMTISQSSAPFSEQAPYCMGSTMAIFAILSMVYKGLDYLDTQKS